MTDETFFVIVFSYVLINIVLFISYKYTRKYKKTHRVISVIDNLLFVVLLGYGFYQWNPWLIILVPYVLLVIYPIAWGMNEELTDDEVASIVISTLLSVAQLEKVEFCLNLYIGRQNIHYKKLFIILPSPEV